MWNYKGSLGQAQGKVLGQQKNKANVSLQLKKKIWALTMKDVDTIQEYFDKLMLVVNQIRLLEEELTEKRVVENVLINLLESFE